jgi:hypothetical protein
MTRFIAVFTFLTVVAVSVAAIATAQSPGDLCTVSTWNNQSVHPHNVLVVTTGPEVLRIPGVEDEPETVTVTDFESQGPISAAVEINSPDGRTSLTWDITCSPPPTTTEPPPTTVDCGDFVGTYICPPETTEPPPTTTVDCGDFVGVYICPPETTVPTTTTEPPPTTTLPPTPVPTPIPTPVEEIQFTG